MRDFFLASILYEMDTDQLARLLESLETKDKNAFNLLKELIEDFS